MTKTPIRVTRAITVPDPIRVARAQRGPDLGPRILFFTGGTALRETSQALVGYTHNSTHLVTPFDSGGSSAVLRQYFGMPAVGDMRSRLMALADRSLHGFPEIYDLFAHRLPKTASPEQLQTELQALVGGSHPLIARVLDPMRKIIRHHLQLFEKSITADFDLRGASIGNLILTAGYLENRRHIDPIVYIYSKLVQVRGQVRLVINADLQLRAVLENGAEIVGQHLITGKETPPLSVPIRELSLTDPARRGSCARPAVRDKIRAAITSSDLICYPIGSFYSSLVANLLPAGIGQAVSQTPCPKVFIPNPGPDPEAIGLDLIGQVRVLLRHLRQDAPDAIAIGDILNFVLLDTNTVYPGPRQLERELATMGIQVIRTPLVDPADGRVQPHLLCQTLVSLAGT
ncbi:MAG: GAK system CofD-like protein [Deltaproteobacteria bacterium]|nr:GAK system CofD-like protein [Deltaproteobacteria bacterium]